MTSIVDRRRFLLTSLAGAIATPSGIEAQTVRVHRVGVLLQGAPLASGATPGPFRVAMQALGYIEGRTAVYEFRGAEGRNERMPSLAAELVALKPDVIVADSTPAAIAVKRATTEIPIVIVNVSDPVGTGIVVSLAHPGGNVTGGTDFGMELAEKGLDLLHSLVPKVSRVAVLMSDNPVHPFQLKLIQEAAKSIHLTVLPTMIRTEADFEEAYASMVRQKAG